MTTITIHRALLEQALESMCWAARVLNIDPDEAPNYHRNLEAIRAELAKPVERVEPIALDQFRAIAHRTATTYRHRSDPEKSSYAFVDGSSLDDFWRKVCEAIQPTSAWNDAPEAIALKAERDAAMKDAERYRFIRDADRSDCITRELSLYALESLDEYVDAAMEDEARAATANAEGGAA